MENTDAFAAQLTGREKQILRLINNGLINKQIAKELSLSIYTVDNHCKKIYRKLNVRDRFEAIYIAEQKDLLT